MPQKNNNTETAEFDEYADGYRKLHADNIAITGEPPEYFAEYKIVDLAMEYRRLKKRSLQPHILDFGGGIGNSIPFMRRHLPEANITCMDVSRKSLETAARKHGNEAKFKHFDGAKIPSHQDAFDIVFVAGVFHHVPHALHAGLMAEIHRVLKSDGLMCIFEHNPYNPLTLRAVNTCPFDENAKLISAKHLRKKIKQAGFVNTHVNYRIFFPKALGFLRSLEKNLTWLPIGAQYYIVAYKA